MVGSGASGAVSVVRMAAVVWVNDGGSAVSAVTVVVQAAAVNIVKEN